MRFFGSFLLACCIVFLMLMVGVRVNESFQGDEEEEGLNLQWVEGLTESQRSDLGDLLGPKLPEAPDISDVPLNRPAGVVDARVLIQVDEGGRAASVTLLSELPAGVDELAVAGQLEGEVVEPEGIPDDGLSLREYEIRIAPDGGVTLK